MKSIQELRQLAHALRQLKTDGMVRRAALVTIVRTHGSTFRRVGASMLVYEDGSIINALSGGCPQRDLVERAREVMQDEKLRYVAYNEEQGFDLMMEAGCGGSLEVAIEPIVSAAQLDYLAALEASLGGGQAFTVSTVFPAAGTTRAALRRYQPVESDRTDALVQGRAEWTTGEEGTSILTESFDAPISLVVAGASEEARHLAGMASSVGWHGVVVDTSGDRLALLALRVDGWSTAVARPSELRERVKLDASTAVIAMTHNLDQDVAYLDAGAAAGAFYLGALGSRDRAGMIRSAVGSPALRVPAGLDIGSNTSAEIALAVIAEIMALRNARSGEPLSATDGPLH